MAKILIVDDSPIMRKNLKKILINAGHTVVAEAQNGMEGYDEYKKHLPDLTTMDITMPVVDGIQAVKNIIKDFPDAKIVMISGLEQKQMVYNAIENGAKHYILKPISVDTVISAIDEILNPDNDDDEDALQELLKPDSESVQKKEITSPFYIENIKGIFKIVITELITENDMPALENFLLSLYFIKPLKVIFDFGDMRFINNTLSLFFFKILEKISSIDGTSNIIAKNNDFIYLIKADGWEKFANIYEDISELL